MWAEGARLEWLAAERAKRERKEAEAAAAKKKELDALLDSWDDAFFRGMDEGR
ncbi:MAG: hypothetical protein WAO08_38670 [Hyphomicrobiaceae bacterium]